MVVVGGSERWWSTVVQTGGNCDGSDQWWSVVVGGSSDGGPMDEGKSSREDGATFVLLRNGMEWYEISSQL